MMHVEMCVYKAMYKKKIIHFISENKEISSALAQTILFIICKFSTKFNGFIKEDYFETHFCGLYTLIYPLLLAGLVLTFSSQVNEPKLCKTALNCAGFFFFFVGWTITQCKMTKFQEIYNSDKQTIIMYLACLLLNINKSYAYNISILFQLDVFHF